MSIAERVKKTLMRATAAAILGTRVDDVIDILRQIAYLDVDFTAAVVFYEHSYGACWETSEKHVRLARMIVLTYLGETR